VKYFKVIFLISIIFLIFVNEAKAQLIVAIAANVQYAMKELTNEFKKETGINVSIIIGSSGELTAQIIEGAPYDIFISADMKYANVLYHKSAAIDSPKVYATGALVIWSMVRGINLENKLNVLLDNRIKNIALANPSTAPYGVAAIQALKYYGIYDKVKNKLVYGESLSPVNQFISSKSVDVGFTSKSVVMSPQMKGRGVWKEIDSADYPQIEQGCVILKYGFSHHKNESLKFYNFLFSKKGKEIFRNFGYSVK
jgi:molybdate transport system substrate-binding protein